MTNNILTYRVTITGTRPMLWHKFGPEAIPLEKQEKTGVGGNDPEEWRRTAMITRNGQLYLEPSYAFGSLREGSKYTKKGKGSLQGALVATLQILEERILVDRYFPGWPCEDIFDIRHIAPPTTDPEEPVFLDVRGVRNPATKARNVRYRIACSSGWKISFRIAFDKTIISRNEMESIIIDAGKLVGLGNGRSIGYGRFDLTSFEIAE